MRSARQAMTFVREELLTLLNEPIASVRKREETALDRLLRECGNRVVLFGSGNLGGQTMRCLRSIGVEPLAFADNNSSRWGTHMEGVPILSPEEAAGRFGSDALFLVTIWNTNHWYSDTQKHLARLGCRQISPVSPVYWRFPDQFLPFFAQDLPHKLYECSAEVLAAELLWDDEASKQEYLRQIRWRALGEWNFTRPGTEESYFADSIFHLTPEEVFLDCGAFDGDTIRGILSRGGFKRILAVEPDPGTFARLAAYVRELEPEVRSRITLLPCAVGAERGQVRFDDTGGLGSRISDEGTVTIESIPIAELVGPAPVTYIKMDIEGAEHDALLGARPLIERDRPILAICVYHRQDDLWRLPLLMKEMLPEHKMYLRLYESDGWQTVAYAVPAERVQGDSSYDKQTGDPKEPNTANEVRL
jgi:FkbM family methyltransferase